MAAVTQVSPDGSRQQLGKPERPCRSCEDLRRLPVPGQDYDTRYKCRCVPGREARTRSTLPELRLAPLQASSNSQDMLRSRRRTSSPRAQGSACCCCTCSCSLEYDSAAPLAATRPARRESRRYRPPTRSTYNHGDAESAWQHDLFVAGETQAEYACHRHSTATINLATRRLRWSRLSL